MKSFYFFCSLMLGCLFAMPADAQSSDSFTLPTAQCVYVRSDGPQKGNNGERFFDVEGKNTGKYACFGVLGFDASTLSTELNKKYGAGKYKIVGVTLALTQAIAKFTKGGSVVIYVSPDSMSDLGALKYPYDPKGAFLKGEPVASVMFVTPASSGGKEGGNAADTSKPSAAGAATEPSADKKPPTPAKVDSFDIFKAATSHLLTNALTNGKKVTLILSDGDPDVAATWAGLKPSGSSKPPMLVIRVTAAK